MPLSAEQLEQRKSLITASDAAAICGVNPYRNAHDVYAEKVGIAQPFTGNYRTWRGDALEPLGVKLLAERHAPLAVKPGTETMTHAMFSWLGATPDAVVLDGDRPVRAGEIKTAGVRQAQKWEDENGEHVVPEHYVCQVQIQMAVLGVRESTLVALLDWEDEPRFYDLAYDADLTGAIMEECDRFRRDHLLPRKPPPIGGSAASARMVRSLFPRPASKDWIDADAGTEALVREYVALRDAESAAKAKREELQNLLCARIGEHEGIRGNGWRALWGWRDETRVEAYTRKAGRVFDLRTVKGRAA